jgi:hypothetical protein
MTPEPQPATPDKFDGRNFPCRQFLNQLGIHFHIYSEYYPSDESKVNYALSLLKGPALDWASTVIDANDPVLHDYPAFTHKISSLYEEPDKEENAENSISCLRQGKDTAVEYVAKFQDIARNVPWNERALIYQFKKGLNDSLKDELAGKDRPRSLEEMIILITRLDNRLAERARERISEGSVPRYPLSDYKKHSYSSYTPKPSSTPVPRGINGPQKEHGDSLSKEERHQARSANDECFYCGKPGHFIGNCQERIRASQLKEKAQSQY